MGTFNYSRFKYFDKNGRELIIKPTHGVKIELKNNFIPEFSAEYSFVNGDPLSNNIAASSSLLPIKIGSRFNIDSSAQSIPANVTITKDGSIMSNDCEIPRELYTVTEYTSSYGTENYPEIDYFNMDPQDRETFLGQNVLDIEESANFFPTYTFKSKINFGKISTGLIETQTIFVLVDNENDTDEYGISKLTTVEEYANTNSDALEYINRFKLFFFIDCRKQSDFKMLHVKYDEIEWSDRSILDFQKQYEDGSNDTGYSVNIGFSGENDGVYEQKLYVCVLDTSTETKEYPGDVYPIGEILMCAETEGEDERYRSFFTNFGIPDPKEYDRIFEDTDISEDFDNFESINRHSKKMFLSYSEIFPYVGSYKALINAVKFLGYEDEVFFKEWYKEVGNSAMDDSGYTTYEITYGSKLHKNVIQNSSISERIHLRKMNWISMLYRMSIEVDSPEDLFGFPDVITNYRNFNTDKLVKLFGLKKWLEKYIIGVNCHIIDIGGEGLVFERYNLQKFGAYQQVIDMTEEGVVSPVIKNSVEHMIDCSANIYVELYPSGSSITIEDCVDKKFTDMCDGYFNEDCVFCPLTTETEDNNLYRYFGKTFEFNDNIESVSIRGKGTHESFIYNSNDSSSIIYDQFSSIIIDKDEIHFDHTADINKPLNSPFRKLPTIEIKRGIIKGYDDSGEDVENLQYYANIYKDSSNGINLYRIDVLKNDSETKTQTYWLDDVPTFIPPKSEKDSNEIIITPPSKRLGIDSSVQDITVTYNKPYTIDSESGVAATYIPQRWSTNYGFRFCIDNADGIPCFKMIGYEEKQIMMESDHFPKLPVGLLQQDFDYEYFVEIIDGRIIFQHDNEDIISVINFEYDENSKKRNIYVTTYKETEYRSIYKYQNGGSNKDFVEYFIIGNSYANFVQSYDTNPENAVIFDNVKPFNVNHAGKYEISAITYNTRNCALSKKAEGICDVKTPSADLIILTADSSSNNAYEIYEPNATYQEIKTIFSEMNKQNECIFEYEPKLQIDFVNGFDIEYSGIQKNTDSENIDYGTLHIVSKKDFSVGTLSSMSDRFDIPCYITNTEYASMNTMFTLIRRTKHTSHLFCDSSTEKDNIISYLNINESTTTNILNELIQPSYDLDGAMMDVTLFVYDIIREYPVYSAPGALLPITNSRYDEYRFMPLLESYADTIKNNFLGDPALAFYVIPTWTIPCTVSHLYSDINELSMNFVYYPFAKTLKNEGMSMISYKNSYHNSTTTRTRTKRQKRGSSPQPTTNSNYFGHGSYKIKNTNIQNPLRSTVSLYAKTVQDPKQQYVNFYGFDGSVWFSPNSLDFMEYKVDLETENSDNTYSKITLVDNSYSRDAVKFVDEQYSVSLRDFDTMYSMQIWDWDSSIYANETYLETTYRYTTPVGIRHPYVSLIPKINDDSEQLATLVDENGDPSYSIEWRIYKRTDGMDRRLIMKCKNKILHLKLIENGTYDVEYDLYDKYGNKYTKIMYNAITCIDMQEVEYESHGEIPTVYYRYSWGDHVCEQKEIVYSFTWSDYVCAVEDPEQDEEWQPITY